ncbi:cytochrome P450 [Martensiomyces pterosporus]|nr:cytochrome P450 [Martensiomyces pterosporus]
MANTPNKAASVPTNTAARIEHRLRWGDKAAWVETQSRQHANLSGCNLNKKSWHEPHCFDPTRFLNNDEAKRNVLTFGSGVRICPGRHLAWIEMMTTLANILKDYDLQLPDDYTLRGPSVLDERGYPQVMETRHSIVTGSKHPLRDCRLCISKHK